VESLRKAQPIKDRENKFTEVHPRGGDRIFEKISVVSMRTYGRGEEAQLSSGWISIR